MLDRDALTGKPVLVGATAGTARHSLALEHALRPLFAYLRAVVVPTAVFAASEDWGAATVMSAVGLWPTVSSARPASSPTSSRSGPTRRRPTCSASPRPPFETLLRGA